MHAHPGHTQVFGTSKAVIAVPICLAHRADTGALVARAPFGARLTNAGTHETDIASRAWVEVVTGLIVRFVGAPKDSGTEVVGARVVVIAVFGVAYADARGAHVALCAGVLVVAGDLVQGGVGAAA